MTHKTNYLELKIILYIVSILIIISTTMYIIKSSNSNKSDIIGDISSEVSSILEDVYNEGFIEVHIDYQDPILLNREIYITTDLDQKTSKRVMKQLKYLEILDDTSPINLFIDTSGGTGGAMLANYIQTIKPPVNTIALDYCCSAGVEVLASGTGIRKAYRSARIIPHLVPGEDSSLDDESYLYSDLVQYVNIEFWRQYSKMPESYYNIDYEIYYNFNSEDALKYGLIDEIID